MDGGHGAKSAPLPTLRLYVAPAFCAYSQEAFDSGTVRGKGRGSITFEQPGTFTYYCQFHATMKGTVTVVK